MARLRCRGCVKADYVGPANQVEQGVGPANIHFRRRVLGIKIADFHFECLAEACHHASQAPETDDAEPHARQHAWASKRVTIPSSLQYRCMGPGRSAHQCQQQTPGVLGRRGDGFQESLGVVQGDYLNAAPVGFRHVDMGNRGRIAGDDFEPREGVHLASIKAISQRGEAKIRCRHNGGILVSGSGKIGHVEVGAHQLQVFQPVLKYLVVNRIPARHHTVMCLSKRRGPNSIDLSVSTIRW